MKIWCKFLCTENLQGRLKYDCIFKFRLDFQLPSPSEILLFLNIFIFMKKNREFHLPNYYFRTSLHL